MIEIIILLFEFFQVVDFYKSHPYNIALRFGIHIILFTLLILIFRVIFKYDNIKNTTWGNLIIILHTAVTSGILSLPLWLTCPHLRWCAGYNFLTITSLFIIMTFIKLCIERFTFNNMSQYQFIALKEMQYMGAPYSNNPNVDKSFYWL